MGLPLGPATKRDFEMAANILTIGVMTLVGILAGLSYAGTVPHDFPGAGPGFLVFMWLAIWATHNAIEQGER
jgi:hypothetical protein